ncbi:MAG TPA: toll/interleukin-1 receptor domain-containing protein [Longimicrobium sp.]|nr:toll/interleukin-1 receptor domain-containing protein [Longimicrobium sp.]
MYLARFSTDEEWVQAVVAIESAPPHAHGPGSVFWDEIARRLSAAALIPRSTVARRIAVDARGGLRQTVAVTAPAAQERTVRQIVAGLTRLERMVGGSLALAHHSTQHDAWMEGPGRLRFCSTAHGFSVRGVPLACDFRVAAALDDLLVDARMGGYALAYQVHVRAAEADPDCLRAARKAVLALQELAGAPAALVERQEQLARAFGYAGAWCEEYLAVDLPDAAGSVSALLADRFRARYGPLGFPVLPVRFGEGAYDEPLVTAVHSHDIDPLAPLDLCGAAVDAAERDRLLGWRPSERVLRLLAPAPLEVGGVAAPEPMLDTGTALEPYRGDGPYAFVSYRRQDLPRLAPILEMLRELGISTWYDRGIPGGAEWDEVIEDRLANARFVLLCASRAAVESRYVRREVKFADALDIPLLCVLLEDEVPFAHGLRMLLTPYQMLNAGSADFAQRLRLAVSHLSSSRGRMPFAAPV